MQNIPDPKKTLSLEYGKFMHFSNYQNSCHTRSAITTRRSTVPARATAPATFTNTITPLHESRQPLPPPQQQNPRNSKHGTLTTETEYPLFRQTRHVTYTDNRNITSQKSAHNSLTQKHIKTRTPSANTRTP